MSKKNKDRNVEGSVCLSPAEKKKLVANEKRLERTLQKQCKVIKICPTCGKVGVSQKHIDTCSNSDRVESEDNLWK